MLVERVQQLLAGGRSRKGGAVIKRAAKTPEIEQAFRRAIEHHAHAIEQINDRRSGFAHAFDERLIR